MQNVKLDGNNKNNIKNNLVNNLNFKPEEKKSFFGKIGGYIKKHPFKSIGWGILGAIGTDVAVRVVNEYVRLPIIYKQLEKEFEARQNSSSVKEYEYRFKGKDGDTTKTLIVKAIPRFSMGSMLDFESEKLACKEIPNLKNEHLSKIVDYHYGLTHLYIVYEKVEDFDWKTEMKDWNNEQKFNWLKDVSNQIVDFALDLYNKGFYHGDLNYGNYKILKKDDKPFVKFFDYGRFYKKKERYDLSNPFAISDRIKNPNVDLMQIAAGMMRLYARTLLAEDVHLTKEEGYEIQIVAMKNPFARSLQALDVDEQLKEKLKTIVENNDIILSRYKFMEIINKQIYTSSNDKFEQKLKEFKEGLNNAKL
ncbi:MAG: hypothetical protein IJQ10_02045 [Clostridia bacterium]|nr:hypothetical protein [Clostridia bacterium]